MLKLSYQIDRLVYNHERHIKDFKSRLTEIYKQAARVFMKEALRYVPGYTGMSRASFAKLAAFLGEDLDLQQVAPKKYITKKKNPELGARRGAFVFKVSNDGLITFDFSTKVAQYSINEFIDATKYRSEGNKRTKGLRKLSGSGRQYFLLKRPGPYYSLNKGKIALTKYLKTNIPKKLPKIKDYITKKQVVTNSFTRF